MAYNDDNTTPATGDAAMRRLKTRLVAGGWTVAASGDGRSAYEAAGDAITADSGAGSLDAAGAWMRLRMGGATREFLFVRKSASTDWTVRYSAAGFSGGSPSATTAPTATDQQTLVDAQLLPADGTYRLLACVEDATPWHWWAAAVPTAGGAARSLLGLWPMRSGSHPAGDAEPYASIAMYDATATATVARVANLSTGHNGFVSGTWRKCIFHVPCSATSGGYDYAGGLANSGALASSGEDLPAEILCSSISGFGGGPTHHGTRGYVRDARWCLSNTTASPHGTHLEQGSRYWLRVGDLWLPWGATPPTL